MRHLQYTMVALGVALMMIAAASGCAQGVSDGNGVPDARAVTFPDANPNAPDGGNPFPDAHSGFPDANQSFPDGNVSTPDAGGSGLFCSTDADCNTGAGECCFAIQGAGVCVVGDPTLLAIGVCFPASN
jgi:hypothetical protein